MSVNFSFKMSTGSRFNAEWINKQKTIDTFPSLNHCVKQQRLVDFFVYNDFLVVVKWFL